MFPLSIDFYAELLAFLVSAITYPRLKGTKFGLFPFFLLFIVLVELCGRYWVRVLHQGNNTWLYNISTPIEFIFYAHIFSMTFQKGIYRTMARRFMIVYPILVLLNFLFIQGFSRWHSYTMVLGSIFMIVFCCLFFYELLVNPVEEELAKDPMFWISAGIFFFYLGGLTYNLLYNLLEKHAGPMGTKLFTSINNNLILILYSCFILAFLCRRNLQRSSSL